jgi:ATP-dependent HslUV protease subunit HslV
LFTKFEAKLEEFQGNLEKAVVELTKDWRTDKILRRLEAMLAIVNREHAYIVSGNGDIVEPEDGLVAIGSGAGYALASAKVLVKYTNLSAKEIVREAISTAASICVYTNDKIRVEAL